MDETFNSTSSTNGAAPWTDQPTRPPQTSGPVFDVRTFGARGDGAQDDRDAINATIAAAFKHGGGIVQLNAGRYNVSGPINLMSDVALKGAGINATVIELAPGALIEPNEAIIQTKHFPYAIGKSMWRYGRSSTPNDPAYSEEDGLHMHFAVTDLSVFGNWAHKEDVDTCKNSHGGGLYVYGGKYTVRNVGIYGVAGHGFWSQCGRCKLEREYDIRHNFLNMHETTVEHLYISNVGQHGFLYRGPTDSYVDRVQVKLPSWACFRFEYAPDIGAGGTQCGVLHGYTNRAEHAGYEEHTYLGNCTWIDLLYIDTPLKNGLVIDNTVMIDRLLVFNHNPDRLGDYWACTIRHHASAINSFRFFTPKEVKKAEDHEPKHGGVLRLTNSATRNIITNCNFYCGSSINTQGEAAILIDKMCTKNSITGIIDAFTRTTGLKTIYAGFNRYDLMIADTLVGVDYDNSSYMSSGNQMAIQYTAPDALHGIPSMPLLTKRPLTSMDHIQLIRAIRANTGHTFEANASRGSNILRSNGEIGFGPGDLIECASPNSTSKFRALVSRVAGCGSRLRARVSRITQDTQIVLDRFANISGPVTIRRIDDVRAETLAPCDAFSEITDRSGIVRVSINAAHPGQIEFQPDISHHTFVQAGPLTGPIHFRSPRNAKPGSRLLFSILQDQMGGRQVTWDADYRVRWPEKPGKPYAHIRVEFIFDSADKVWVQQNDHLEWN